MCATGILMSMAFCFQVAVCVNLQLSHMSSCTFHLVHLSDVYLVEDILQANQHGQPWVMVSAIQQPLMKLGPSTELDGSVASVSLNLQESRVCNIHLFFGPDPRVFPFAADYVQRMTVTSMATTHVIFISLQDGDEWYTQYPVPLVMQQYVFNVFIFLVEDGDLCRKISSLR